MKKSKLSTKIAIALCAVALTGVGAVIVESSNTQIVLANHQGTKLWVQYGTLKYALKGPSGRVYPAGTKVVRTTYDDDKPDLSIPGRSFNLTWQIGGKPGLNIFQDTGGGSISETYVNYDNWQEIDYPASNVVLVNNTSDSTDLKSRDFHPVDSSNSDVPVADTSKLNSAYVKFTITVNFQKLSASEMKYVANLQDRVDYAKDMGATQESVDTLTQEINDVIAKYKATGHLIADNKPSNTTGNSGSDSANNKSTSTTVSSSRKVRLRKASYRYTSKGKRVSKKLLKKGSIVTINGKTYHIKGKAYYRIGKNRYIRVANVAKS